MRRRALIVLLGPLVLLGALVRPAHAQDADHYFQQGVEALRVGDPERAATMFEKSYELQPRAATLCNLALSYDHWDDHEEIAAETYDRCAEEDRSGRFRAHARERSRDIRQDLAASRGSTDAPPEIAPPAPPPGPPAGSGDAPAPAPPPSAQAPPPVPAPSDGANWNGPVAPGPRGAVITWPPPAGPAPAPERSHTLLWVGLGSGLLAGAALVAGFITVQGVQADADYLDEEYDGGERTIRDGSADAELLDSARGRSDFATALYVVGGALGALAVGLVIADVARGDDTPAASAAVLPLPGGALATVRATLP